MSVSTDRDKVLEQVLALLESRSSDGSQPLAADSLLRDSVLMDSFQALELVMALEEAFDVTFKRSDLEALDTPGRIADLILSKRPEG